MDAFEALAEPNRRRILDLLCAGERPAGLLGKTLAICQPGVSKHLRMLREAGLVESRASGQKRIYRLVPGKLAEIDAWLDPYRQFWAGRLDALEAHLERE